MATFKKHQKGGFTLQKTNKAFFISLIVFISCWLIYLFKPFWMCIIIGILLAISTSNMYNIIYKLTKNKKTISAIITTLVFSLIILGPLIYAVAQIIQNLSNINTDDINKTIDYVKGLSKNHMPYPFAWLEPKIKDFIANFDVAGAIKNIISFASGLGVNGAKFLFDTLLIVVFYFFAILYSENFNKYFKAIIPINPKELDFIFSQMTNTMSVVFYSTLFNSILQGFLFAVIAYCYDFDGLLFGVIYAFSCLIPGIGGALVYVPMSIYSYFFISKSSGIVILIYSIVMISTIADNFIKPMIIKFINSNLIQTSMNINELLLFFSMIAGITTFGFWGVFLGPAILTMFLATLKLYEIIKSKNFE